MLQGPQDGRLRPPPPTCQALASAGAPLQPDSWGPARAGEVLPGAPDHRREERTAEGQGTRGSDPLDGSRGAAAGGTHKAPSLNKACP